MTTTTAAPAAEEVAERLMGDTLATFELFATYLGLELGLYAALAAADPMTATQLATSADIHPRYAREWLEQQTAAGMVTCTDVTAAPDARRFTLPAAVAEAMLDESSPAYVGAFAAMITGVTDVLRDVATAYRTGGGVPFSAYGADVRHGLGRMNGAIYDAELAGWVAAMPDVDALLRNTGEPRILDLGCGTGRSTIALARAYPHATVRGVDLDAASVEDARRTAAEAGVAHRVTFVVGDAANVDTDESFHLITILEALHDIGDPIGTLETAHRLLADGGAVLVSDERVADEFSANAEFMERLQYGFSVLHCLPATMAEEPKLASGTVLRAPTVDAWARTAGFDGAVDLGIHNEFWRIYRL